MPNQQVDKQRFYPATVQPSGGRFDLFWMKISTTASVAESRGAIFIPICFFFSALSATQQIYAENISEKL